MIATMNQVLAFLGFCLLFILVLLVRSSWRVKPRAPVLDVDYILCRCADCKVRNIAPRLSPTQEMDMERAGERFGCHACHGQLVRDELRGETIEWAIIVRNNESKLLPFAEQICAAGYPLPDAHRYDGAPCAHFPERAEQGCPGCKGTVVTIDGKLGHSSPACSWFLWAPPAKESK